MGCGGRGTGAASQALHADDYAELTAVADIDQAQIDKSPGHVEDDSARSPSRVKAEPAKQFLGLDAYQKLIDSGVDVVLLATPPGFRPTHLAACIDAQQTCLLRKADRDGCSGRALGARDRRKRRSRRTSRWWPASAGATTT